MSRTQTTRKRRQSSHKHSRTIQYKVFIWDIGTDGRKPHESHIRTLAAVEFSGPTNKLAHFSTAVRPANATTKISTPTFPDAWKSFLSYITEHTNGQPPLLVSHNAAFDVTVLLAELRRANIKFPSRWRFACSLLFSRSISPFNSDNSQIALAGRLQIPIHRQHHTPEDVIVLRRILIALDNTAIENDQPSNRVLPALCLHARPAAFFDRTPQTSTHPSNPASPTFFITHTGTRYHRQECKWLSRSRIPRNSPPPGFKACRACRPDKENYVTRGKSTNKDESSPVVSTKLTSSSPTQFFITKSGVRYHIEGCKWLSKSKIPLDIPPEDFKPCGTCMKDLDPAAAIQEKSRSLLSPGRNRKSSKDALYYITRTGGKYHLRGCKSLARSRIPRNEPPPGYEPCGICLPNLAYLGSPQLKTLSR